MEETFVQAHGLIQNKLISLLLLLYFAVVTGASEVIGRSYSIEVCIAYEDNQTSPSKLKIKPLTG